MTVCICKKNVAQIMQTSDMRSEEKEVPTYFPWEKKFKSKTSKICVVLLKTK
jgi:hypothetical protein